MALNPPEAEATARGKGIKGSPAKGGGEQAGRGRGGKASPPARGGDNHAAPLDEGNTELQISR